MLLWMKKYLDCPQTFGVIIIGNICILLSFVLIYVLNRDSDYGELLALNVVQLSPLACVELVAAIILIVVSFLLMIGAMKRQQKLIKLWLIVMAVYIIFEIVTLTTAPLLPQLIILEGPPIVHLFVTFLMCSFCYYVYQFDKELGMQRNQTRYNGISVNKV